MGGFFLINLFYRIKVNVINIIFILELCCKSIDVLLYNKVVKIGGWFFN